MRKSNLYRDDENHLCAFMKPRIRGVTSEKQKHRQAMSQNILFGFPARLLRFPKSQAVRLRVRPNGFHHLAGLHKLRDISIARENRQTVFRDILAGRITYRTIEKSVFVDESRLRLETFQFIEDLLDGEQLVFRFNKKVLPYSLIDGEFLLKMGTDGAQYFFLIHR